MGTNSCHHRLWFQIPHIFYRCIIQFVWIYFLKAKSETYHAILQFIAQAEKQTSCEVKVTPTDGGAEFKPLINFRRKEWLKELPTHIHQNRMD